MVESRGGNDLQLVLLSGASKTTTALSLHVKFTYLILINIPEIEKTTRLAAAHDLRSIIGYEDFVKRVSKYEPMKIEAVFSFFFPDSSSTSQRITSTHSRRIRLGFPERNRMKTKKKRNKTIRERVRERLRLGWVSFRQSRSSECVCVQWRTQRF